MSRKSLAFFILGSIFGMNPPAWARQEYAAREKISCSACHVTPWGGGPRNVFGKVYGTRNLNPSPTSLNDVYYGDLRGVAYYPFVDTVNTVNGVALMEAAATANVLVIPGKSSDTAAGSEKSDAASTEMRAVVTYNIAPLSGSQLREGYVRFQFPSDSPTLATHLLIGHFNTFFGLLTDEHRTYTRIQTSQNLNNYFTGVALSHDFSQDIHSDLALVNDFQSGGSLTNADLSWGTIANVRWNPTSLPILLGLSGLYQHSRRFPEPYAGSLYGVFSLDRLTNRKARVAVLAETVLAKNWNNPTVNTGGINTGIVPFFVSSSGTLPPALATTTSLGNVVQLKWEITPHWTAVYKFDYLALDASLLGRNYTRHGFGPDLYINSNLILSARVEFNTVPSDQVDLNVLAAQNDFYAMLRLWI